MSELPIAAQMYTLREFLKTPADIAATLARVRKIGFKAVQLSALGPIDPKELAKILHQEGLTCCATHSSLDRLRGEPAAVLEEHHLWNCSYTALGYFNPEPPSGAGWRSFAQDFNAVARHYANTPLALGYHNHSNELAKFDGTTALDLLRTEFDRHIFFEIDTYWITHGGGDPAAWIDKFAGRVPCVHLKDMGIQPGDRKQFMMEVGEGNLNWPAILQACKRAGTKWYIIEQDTCYRDPFESLAISLRNVQEMLGG